MVRRTALVMALVAGALLSGLATPAHADQTPERTCRVTDGGSIFPPTPPYDYSFTGVAYYERVPNNPGFRMWTRFRYQVSGVANLGDKSNVNIRVYDNGRVAKGWNSTDDRQAGVWYDGPPPFPIYTTTVTTGPNGERDHRANDHVSWEAIFDRPRRADPRCWAVTPYV